MNRITKALSITGYVLALYLITFFVYRWMAEGTAESRPHGVPACISFIPREMFQSTPSIGCFIRAYASTRLFVIEENHPMPNLGSLTTSRTHFPMTSNKTYEQELRERDLRQKQLDGIVSAAMTRVMSAIARRQPSVSSHFSYGASAIHPPHLVTWHLFRTDAEWETAKTNGLTSEIERLTRAELVSGGYPAEGARQMMVSFTSDEDIQRETGGDQWAYFK